MSNKLPKQFLNEMFLRRLDRMKIDPEQTLPEDFCDTIVEDDDTQTESGTTIKFFE